MGRAKGNVQAVGAVSRGRVSQAQQMDSTAFAATIEFKMFPRAGQPEKEDGYTIAKAIHEETGETIILKGKYGPVVAGELIQIADSAWRDDASRGAYVQVWRRAHSDPTTREGLLHYLEHLPGVGETMAIAIVDQLGTDCLVKIDADPNLLLSVKTKGGRSLKAEDLAEVMNKWEDLRADRKNLLFLSSMGLGDATARKVSAKFGSDCVDKVRANPYSMTEVDGVGFTTADHVARNQGIALDDPRRIAAGMEYLLERAENDGHICLSREEMLQRAPELLARGSAKLPDQLLRDGIDSMVADGRLWVETASDGTERIYTTELYTIETRLYDHLERMLAPVQEPDEIPSYLAAPKESMLTDEQWSGVWRAKEYQMSLLTGGPGTGKTTTLRELIGELDKNGETYALLAPTGKAAKRMAESTGEEAMTVHRKLGWTGRETPTSMTQTEPKPFKEDVVIVDESSMLDMRLAERLLSHVQGDTRVVFVGDPDQLPAVGAGSVLLDLIESKRVPTTKLTQIHRQGAGSLLVENSHRIRQGLEPYWDKDEAEAATGKQFKDDFHFIEAANARETLDKSLRAAKRASSALNVPDEDVLVAAPTKAGGAGVHVLNQKLQAIYNPNGVQVRDNEMPLRVGDRAMNIQNRYGKPDKDTGEVGPDIMNGDTGRIVDYNPQSRVTTVEFEEGELKYGPSQLEALIPAYASTVHKLQGSEAPAIVCPVIGSDSEPGRPTRMLSRNLIYTGLTRARQMGVLVGSKDAIRAAVKIDGSRRNTTLDLRVGAIPQLIARRHEAVKAKGVQSAQALLGPYAVNKVGHADSFVDEELAAAG